MSNVVNKDTFTAFKNKEGNFFKEKPEGEFQEVKLSVKKPDYATRQKAENFYSQKFREYVDAGCFIHDELKRVLTERKLWSNEHEEKFKTLITDIAANEIKLRKGGIRFSEMTKLARENMRFRSELTNLLVNYNSTEQMTAEFKAQQAQFNWLVSHCTFDEKGNPFFKNFEDYCKQDELGNPVVNIAGASLFKLMNGGNEDYRKDWPEFKLLRKHNLIDDKLRYTDKNGNYVDENGKPVNEKGQWINEKNEPIDADGNVIDQTELGEMEDAVFLDD